MAIPKKLDLNDKNSRRVIDVLKALGIDISKEKSINISLHRNSLIISYPEDWDQSRIVADTRSFDFWDNPEDSIYDNM
jgi:hypothetical protein